MCASTSELPTFRFALVPAQQSQGQTPGRAGQPRRAVRRAIEATELGAKALEPIGTLSRGFKQRVGVAQAILHQPKCLILDEPTNGLDPQQTQQMRTLIRELSVDATVILSTHIMQEVEAICDRVIIINKGELVANATLAELKKDQQQINLNQ